MSNLLTSGHLPQKITVLHILTPWGRKKKKKIKYKQPYLQRWWDKCQENCLEDGDNWEGVQKDICWLQLACAALLRTIYRVLERQENTTGRLQQLQKNEEEYFAGRSRSRSGVCNVIIQQNTLSSFLKGGQI